MKRSGPALRVLRRALEVERLRMRAYMNMLTIVSYIPCIGLRIFWPIDLRRV